MLLLVAVLAASFINASPAFANGETYTWSGDKSVVVSGGPFTESFTMAVIQEPGSMVLSNAQPGILKGSPTVSVDGAACYGEFQVTFSNSGSAKKKSFTPITGTVITAPGAPARCTQAQIDKVWPQISDSITILGSRSGSPTTEQPEKRFIYVWLAGTSTVATGSPKSINFHLTGTNVDKTITVDGADSIQGQATYNGNFSDISPGKYKVCPSAVYTDCQDVEKKLNEVLTVKWGTDLSVGNNVLVHLLYSPNTGDYASEQTYGPFNIIIKDASGKEVANQSASIKYTPSDACKNLGNCPSGAFSVGSTVSFKDLAAGSYKACVHDKTDTCKDFTYSGSGITDVNLAFSKEDVTTTATDKATCTGGALGWMLCPLVDVFTDVINTTAGFLNNLLFISPIGSNTSLQSIWGTFVGIANLLLVIAFLVVIFSQATSIGLSAYGIKKMLPRIIAAALLINLSYFICTIALDITNIIGGTVGGMVQSFIPDGSTLSDTTVLHRSDSWASWIKVALAASVVGAIAAAVGAIAFIVPILLSAAFAVLSIFLVVILRQVIIILLIIIAPLAFAAMVLPNTESLFTKWQKTFVNMLVMYPVIMFILYGSQLVGALILASKSTAASGTAWIFDLSSGVAMTAAPAGLLYMFVANQNKLMNMVTGGIGKLAKAARKSTTGWAKEKQGNSRFARARAWNKSLKEANRIERQGKMTGFQGGLNKAVSFAAGPSLNPRKWRENAGKYQASAVNRAAIEADKIFKEDKGNAAAEYAKNGIGGPLMVEHARSGRVVKQNADGSFSYGRKLTEAEHSAAVEWTMANGKLAERQKVYGSDWAAKGRTPEYSRALDTMNDGYFHVNKDVARFGNKFGGSMTSGSVGGDLGVDNAAFLNMASGKTSAEAIIDNDMAQTLANLSALSDTDLATRFEKLVPQELADQGVTPDQYVAMFRANVKQSAETVFSTRELNAKVKPEFAGALKELAKLQAPDAKRLKDAADHHTEVQASKDKIEQPGGQDEITTKLNPSLTTIQPAPNKPRDE